MTHSLKPLSLPRPPILLSQCLLGDPVRYDGAHKLHPRITQLLAHIEAHPLCPEMAAGMGVPRPAIRRQQLAGEEIIALASSGTPLANKLKATSHALASGESAQRAVAAILKARSPSCGIQSSPLFNAGGDIVAQGDGVFVQQLQDQQRSLLMVSEEQLQQPKDCVQFLRLCQLALALRMGILSEDWLAHLYQANALHQLPEIGLQTIARSLGSESVELSYLEPLPFVLLER